MGKQFDKLALEQLKQYYSENLEAYKNTKAVALDLISVKTQFVSELYGKLKKASEVKGTFSSQEDIMKHQVYQEESDKVFDEMNISKNEWHQEVRKVEASGENTALNKLKVDVLEKKLDFIEEELNNRGILIKIVNGAIVFEDK